MYQPDHVAKNFKILLQIVLLVHVYIMYLLSLGNVNRLDHSRHGRHHHGAEIGNDLLRHVLQVVGGAALQHVQLVL